MKIIKQYLVVIVALLLAGCGGSSGSSPATDTVTVSGALGTGTITPDISDVGGSVMLKTPPSPVSGYKVIAINNSTNDTYSATSGSDGSFSLDLPADAQFQISIIANGSYVGPTVFGGSGSEVNMVLKPTVNANLGDITIDETNGYARTGAVPAAVDTSVVAVATNGKPYGAGPDVDGKNVLVDVTNRDDMDMDRDGIPNLFDADEDNDGSRNGIAVVSTDIAGTSTIVENVFITSNIWVPHGETGGLTHAEYAPAAISMRIMVTPKSGKEDQIASVQCVDVPSDIEDSATMNIGSIGDAIDYPAEHSSWKTNSYNLYKMRTETPDSWIAAIAPNTVMRIGDTFTVRVTYADTTYEDFFLTTSYVLTDWAWIDSYNGTLLTDSVGTRESMGPANVLGGALMLVFKKPLDEDGVALEGLEYTVQYGETTQEPSSGRWMVPTSKETIPSGDITDNGDGTLTATIPGLEAGKVYYVVPVAESADGQRNGEETWFRAVVL